VIEQDLMALGVVLAVTAASPNRPPAMAASRGTRMKTGGEPRPADRDGRQPGHTHENVSLHRP